jgi:sugar/nucleoside kinase (ribokinase family)
MGTDTPKTLSRLVSATDAPPPRFKAFLGFDGFIDRIVRVVDNEDSLRRGAFLPSIKDFVRRLDSKNGLSCAMELSREAIRPGGNAPVMALALSRLGAQVACVGALGSGRIFPEFRPLLDMGCALFGIADPGETTALEFDDGKIMLAEIESLRAIDWSSVVREAGLPRLQAWMDDSDILGLVNWSEVLNTTGLWRGIVEEILPRHRPNKEQMVFFDLADCSRRPYGAIREALELMAHFTGHFFTVLGMNENEARLVASVLGFRDPDTPLEALGNRLHERIHTDVCIIHLRERTLSWRDQGFDCAKGFVVAKPRRATGVGDNFNAGFCVAHQLGLSAHDSLVLGNAVAADFVVDGESPTWNGLQSFIVNHADEIE